MHKLSCEKTITINKKMMKLTQYGKSVPQSLSMLKKIATKLYKTGLIWYLLNFVLTVGKKTFKSTIF